MGLIAKVKKKLGAFELDIDIEASKPTALLGASGSGKSMALKLISGVETPDSGFISLNGRVLYDSKKKISLSPQKRLTGLMFQNYALFPNMTARQNIEAAVRSKNKAKVKETATSLINAMKLEAFEGSMAGKLSGGQRQRAALARCLASQPECLLLDEPFSSLDSYLKWQMEIELSEALKAFDGPSLFVTHDRGEAMRICENVYIMDEGKSSKPFSTAGIMASPESLPAALISGCKNFSKAVRTGPYSLNASDWGVELITKEGPKDETSYIGVRSNHFYLANGPGQNIICCSIYKTIKDVATDILICSAPTGGLITVEGEGLISLSKNHQAQVYIGVEPGNIMLLKEA